MSNHAKNAVFVDGANVAKEYEAGKSFSVVGLLRCAVYFRQKEFQAKVILHRNYRTLASTGRLDDGAQLMKLEGNGLVVFSPIGQNENEFLVQLALDHGGIIVSNETFENEKVKRQDWAHFLNRRRLPFRFINQEFAPLPPTVDGHVMEIEEFLHAPYDMGGDMTSAAALTSYLLTMKLDESDANGTTNDRSGGNQRARARSRSRTRTRSRTQSGPGAPQRRYTVGQVIEVASDLASVEFQTNKDGNTSVTSFARDAYHPHGRQVRDLCREFREGDWIGFISVRTDGRWTVEEVRKKGEMKRGYGRYRPLASSSMSGLIEARYKTESGGGDIFFPGSAFRDEGTLLENLHRGHWLYYYAFDQKPSAGCTAVAVEVFSATAAGVIVKKTERNVYVWSVKTGIAKGELVRYPEGSFVKFRFQQRSENGRSYWLISNLEVIPLPAGVKIESEEMEDTLVVHIRCPAIVGVLTESYGTIWTEAFGRMNLSSNSLKQIFKMEPNGLQPYQPVRIWAMYNGVDTDEHPTENGNGDEAAASVARGSTTTEDGWRVISMIANSGAAGSGAEPPYPPPSVIFGVEATLLDSEDDKNSDRGQHWIFKSEKFGKIFATPFDVAGGQKQLNIGDRIKASIVPQPLRFGDEYRAFVVEKTN